MASDPLDAREVLERLAELKRTLPEHEYQEIERQVLPRLAAHFEGSKPAGKKNSRAVVLLWVIAIAVLVALVALADRFPWLRFVWYAWLAFWAVTTLYQILTVVLSWLSDVTKPPGRY